MGCVANGQVKEVHMLEFCVEFSHYLCTDSVHFCFVNGVVPPNHQFSNLPIYLDCLIILHLTWTMALSVMLNAGAHSFYASPVIGWVEKF